MLVRVSPPKSSARNPISRFGASHRVVIQKRNYTTGSCETENLPAPSSAYYIRRSSDRGFNDFQWLQSKYTFSFAPFYKDQKNRGFRNLRVINDDVVQPTKGFETHSHKDMEIITYPLSGQVSHKDSLGNSHVINVGEVQRMSAGTGITHSEFNPHDSTPAHFLQIWIIPQTKGVTPSYQQIKYNKQASEGSLHLIAAPFDYIKQGVAYQPAVHDNKTSDAEGHVRLHQDVNVYTCYFSQKKFQPIKYNLKENRGVWVHVVKGSIALNQLTLSGGDGVGVQKADGVNSVQISPVLTANEAPEFLLFDLN